MQVTLSRRNLLTLLAGLEMPESWRTVIKPDGTIVTAEPDEIHYKDRQPGRCSTETQGIIDEIEACLARRRRLEED